MQKRNPESKGEIELTDDNNRLKNIESKLDDHGETLKDIANTLSKIAVQDEKIKYLDTQQQILWRKYDALVDPNSGQLAKIAHHQASCPRDQLKFIWWVLITGGLGLLGIIDAIAFR